MSSMGEPVTRIERQLRTLGPELAFPATPPLVASVTSRLLAERAATPSRRPFPGVALWTRRRALAVAVLGLLLLGGVAVAGRLAIGAIGVRIVQHPSAGGPTATERDLGQAVPLEDVAAMVGFEPAFPPALGEPDDVRVARTWSGARLAILAWRSAERDLAIPGTRWSTLLMQLPGDDELAVKQVLGGGSVEPATVAGADALWIGGPHELILMTPEGDVRLRIEANTLIWQRGGITYRLETLLDKPDARALAETVG